jgi:nitrate reductase NapE component
MQKKFENPVEESGAAFACAILLLNILTLAAVGGIVWLLQMIITLHSPLNTVLRETAWR